MQCENPHALVHPPSPGQLCQVLQSLSPGSSCANGSWKSSLDTHWRPKYACLQLAPDEHAESSVKTRDGVAWSPFKNTLLSLTSHFLLYPSTLPSMLPLLFPFYRWRHRLKEVGTPVPSPRVLSWSAVGSFTPGSPGMRPPAQQLKVNWPGTSLKCDGQSAQGVLESSNCVCGEITQANCEQESC